MTIIKQLLYNDCNKTIAVNGAPQLGFGTHRATAPRYGLLENYYYRTTTIK